MNPRYHVERVEDLGDRIIRIFFKDGGVRTVDFTKNPLINRFSDDDFATLAVTDSDTIGWLGKYDLAPDVLRGDFVPNDNDPYVYVDDYAGPGLRHFDDNVFQPLPEPPHMGDMPRISAFYGIYIFMRWDEHGIPHFHAKHAEYEISVRIVDGKVLAGSMPINAMRLLKKWRKLHVKDLLENWERSRLGQEMNQISGLK